MATILSTGVTTVDIAFGAVVLVAVWLWISRSMHIPKGLRLPPGPPGKFIIGNAGDMPKHHEWEIFTRWAQDYGGLVSVNVFGQPIVFVNNMTVAEDLFEKKSRLYSDRCDFPMLNDLMGLDWALGFMHYGERWRRHRKEFHQHFRRSACAAYHEIQVRQTQDLLRRLHESPEDFVMHLRHLAGAIIMEIVYGIKVLPADDPYIQIAEEAMSAVAKFGNPGTFLVDTLPILKHVPAWIPGAGFQKKASAWRVPITKMCVLPFAVVKAAFHARTAGPSVIRSSLQRLSYHSDAPTDEEEVIRNAGAVAYGAGSETMVSALTSFVLAMVLHPEVQQTAQVELDTVVGMNRLPDFNDREHLPYLNAVCKEVHRWHPVLPLGIAHRVTQDDKYRDNFIPGGSVVVGNAWAILHDEKVYGPNPENFNPERFLKPGVVDPTAAFGFGRRICPGRYMADDSVFIAVAFMLKVFDITVARDEYGKEMPIEPTFTSGFTSHPEPFRCSIQPRSWSVKNVAKHADA